MKMKIINDRCSRMALAQSKKEIDATESRDIRRNKKASVALTNCVVAQHEAISETVH